jgi:hypothetical protein
MAKPKSTNPLDALEKLQQTLSRKTPAKKASSPQMMLPPWSENVRRIPNAILRGTLFGVSQKRETLKKYTKLTTLEGVQISFKGETFNQHDLDVLETLLHLARDQPINAPVTFTSHAMLKELGRGTGQNQYAQLVEELERLNDSSIRFSVPGELVGMPDVKKDIFYGNMLKDYRRRERHDGTHEHVIWFDEKVLRLYGLGYSEINWQQRLALTSSLARWLHGFFASHAKPYSYKVETYRALCGTKVERLGDFRKMLRKALDELEACDAIKKGTHITSDDLVVIKKAPTSSQQRHLGRRQKSAGHSTPSRHS